jgi:hypothetical protein
VVGGVLFGFAPFRFAQLSHVQLLNFYWAPLALICLDRFLRRARWRDGAAFTACFCLQVLASAYLAFMTAVAVLVYVGYWIVAEGSAPIRRVGLRALACLGAAALVLVPTHLPYAQVHREWAATRPLIELVFAAPDLWNYLTAPPTMNDLYVGVFRALGYRSTHEKWLFPGLVLPALVALGFVGVGDDRARRLRRLFGILLVVAILLSLGPRLVVGDRRTSVYLPYAALYHLIPGWSGMRVPGRFVLLAVLASVPIATLGAWRCARIVERWSRSVRWARLAPALSAVSLVALIVLELGAKSLPLVRVPTGIETPPVYAWLAAQRPGPVLEIPIGTFEGYRYQAMSTAHWLPLVNGVSGFFPPTWGEVGEDLRTLPSRAAVERAAALGARVVVLHRALLSVEDERRWSREAIAEGGLTPVARFGPDEVFGLPATALAATLDATLVVRPRVPPATRVSVALDLRPAGGALWAHPAPYGFSHALVQWTPSPSGAAAEQRVPLRLPLVVAAGPGPTMTLRTPPTPGTYAVSIAGGLHGVTGRPELVDVAGAPGVTSRDGAAGLSAVYTRPESDPPRVVTEAPVHVTLTATNTGRAIWLAVTDDRGAVKLNWRWFRDGKRGGRPGRLALRHDVYPGESYRFEADIEAPPAAGRYLLELGLVSEGVAYFSERGTAPSTLTVDVVEAATR